MTNGDADLEIDGSSTKLAIESLSEVRYMGIENGKNAFELQNGYLWVDSPSGDTIVKLKLFSVTFINSR